MSGPRRIIISGCSGGGKSTLLTALADRGHKTVEEAGRRVVRTELTSGGDALPWRNAAGFTCKALELSITDYENTSELRGPVFFDRAVIDALAYAARMEFSLEPNLIARARNCHYDQIMFMAPPWLEIFAKDAERQHDFDDAVTEYEHLLIAYRESGYTITLLPKTIVAERVNFVMALIADEAGKIANGAIACDEIPHEGE